MKVTLDIDQYLAVGTDDNGAEGAYIQVSMIAVRSEDGSVRFDEKQIKIDGIIYPSALYKSSKTASKILGFWRASGINTTGRLRLREWRKQK